MSLGWKPKVPLYKGSKVAIKCQYEQEVKINVGHLILVQ